jgi:hypothetical protein
VGDSIQIGEGILTTSGPSHRRETGLLFPVLVLPLQGQRYGPRRYSRGFYCIRSSRLFVAATLLSLSVSPPLPVDLENRTEVRRFYFLGLINCERSCEVRRNCSKGGFMPCLLSSGFDSLYCLGTAPAHVARSNALGSLNTR